MMTIKLATNSEGREIFVVNTNNGSYFDGTDIIYIPGGNFAQIAVFEKATVSDLNNAFGPTNSDKLMGDLGKEIKRTWAAATSNTTITSDDPAAKTSDPEETKEAGGAFDKAVEYMENQVPEKFVYLVLYSRLNNNRFPEDIEELAGAINADDCWCTAIINKAHKINSTVEQSIFETFIFDEDFIKILRKKNVAVDYKVAAYMAMYESEIGRMGRAIARLNRLEREYIKFMDNIAK